MRCTEARNFIDELVKHNKNLLFLKMNKELKKFINSMPPELKRKLTQKGVVCDVYTKYNKNYFRIRVFHNALAQDLKNSTTQNAIKTHMKLFKKYHKECAEFLNLFEGEIIINFNNFLNKYMTYISLFKPNYDLKNEMRNDFQIYLKDPAQIKILEDIKQSIKETNAKIRALKYN